MIEKCNKDGDIEGIRSNLLKITNQDYIRFCKKALLEVFIRKNQIDALIIEIDNESNELTEEMFWNEFISPQVLSFCKKDEFEKAFHLVSQFQVGVNMLFSLLDIIQGAVQKGKFQLAGNIIQKISSNISLIPDYTQTIHEIQKILDQQIE